MEKISVIIPTLNEAENIIGLVDFFDNVISGTSVEVIIADSPDTNDSTPNLVQREYITYIQTAGRGRAVQMNEAAAKARGDILVFLHADVTPPDTFVRDIAETIKEGYAFGFFSYRFEPSSFMLDINASFTLKDGIFAGGGDQIHFMTRNLYAQMGGYDESFCIMEDFDFTRRIRKKGILLKVISHPATVSSRKYKNNSWLKVNFLNLLVFIMFRLRIHPQKIKDLCYSHLKTS